MKDPIGSFDTIKENFIRYVKTAFKTKFEDLEIEREALLNQDKVLYRKPWIEPIPEYKSSNKRISTLKPEDIPGMSENQREVFKSLVTKGLFPDKYELHKHQAEMLSEALSGKNCIITSGTGSGKTESFLLPLFAQISKEIPSWELPNRKGPYTDNWWMADLRVRDIVDPQNGFTLSKKVEQRAHETRPKAMRSMILYPMNALVEDQMTRLRVALDSDSVRAWFKEKHGDNRISFGRYNGDTPIAGKLEMIQEDGISVINKYKVDELKRALESIHRNEARITEYIKEEKRKENKVDETEIKSFFPRLDGSEMRSRFDMQIAPPDILITNFSMLSIMLMREIDSPVFENTRQWLACEDLPEDKRKEEKTNRIFHLVIDELHLYRGTQGTETAYLLKLLMKRLGLHPNHPQLRILASSASLEPGDNRSLEYVSDFFGFLGVEDVKSKFKIITGELESYKPLNNDKDKLPLDPFIKLCKAFDNSKKDFQNEEYLKACIESGNQLKKQFQMDISISTEIDFLRLLLNPELKLKERFFEASSIIDNGVITPKAVCTFRSKNDDVPENIPYFFESIFGQENETDLFNAARGLLIARSMFDQEKYKPIFEESEYKLQRFRFHYFFRNIEGLWASTSTNQDDSRTVGKIYSTSKIKSEDGHRVLELLYCDNCGTTLFGGKRGAPGDSNAFCELLPISPNIEGIPEKTPAKLVEKRSHQEFGIFWPQGNQEFIPNDRIRGDWDHITDAYWRQITLGEFNAVDYTSRWVEAYLNKFTGDVSPHSIEIDKNPENWVKGYFFRILSDSNNIDVTNPRIPDNLDEYGNLVDTHKGLPCVCPSCGVNEQYRAKGSSIRGFRTGFAKTTQLFAKELAYQLPEDPKQKKLVVFSDSREDAAQISNGIERNHFTDLLREILIEELHSDLLVKSKIVADNGNNKELFKSKYKIQFSQVQGLIRDSQIDEDDPVREFRKRRNKAISQLDKIKKRIVKVNDLVHLMNTDDCAPLIKKFIQLGINPGGPSIHLQKIPRTNTPWYNMFDFENESWKNDNHEFQEEIRRGTFVQMASLFFGNLFYSIESSGLGYLTIDPNSEPLLHNSQKIGLKSEILLETINSSIRILGHKYKYTPNDFDDQRPLDVSNYSSFPSIFKKYVRRVGEKNNIQERILGEAVLNTLSSENILGNLGIRIQELYIKVAAENDPVWISPRGFRRHLHKSAGVCTQYPESTDLSDIPDTNCGDYWNENYLSYHSAIENRKSIRLHCEELTGQTDDQFERQRHFRNIILQDEGHPLTKTIDLLSVTTTLEVGVDIGSLQAVMLANMPPQRFNYQQRVGRAGRRGQSYSAILTFCRGRSHDEFYFNNPHKITGDPPPPPFLTISQKRIIKRLIAKEVLRQSFSRISTDVKEDLLTLPKNERSLSVHGEFGKKDHWEKYKPEIQLWLNENEEEVDKIIHSLNPNINSNDKSELKEWFMDNNFGFLSKLDQVIKNDEIATKDISEKLAEGGILPMFGMPTSVRNLYHEITNEGSNYELKAIDRNTDLAIYEFSPGAQKTKDKAIHTSIGFTSDYITNNGNWAENPIIARDSPFYNERWMIKCRNCNFIATENSEPNQDVCSNCGEPEKIDIFQIKSPVAYRTNLSDGKDSKENSEVNLSRPPILAEVNREDNNIDTKNGRNFQIRLADRDITWRINTNGDRYFEGKILRTGNQFPFDRSNWINLNNQWILRGTEEHREFGYRFNLHDNENDFEKIALASHKNTEVLRISPEIIPEAITLDMFDQSLIFNTPGIRSAFYSAAFLLQRIIADKLDVDPVEIEIADIRKVDSSNGRETAEIILTDELPNGSGFVRNLFDGIEDTIESLITKQNDESYVAKIHSTEHRETCQDSCYDCLKVFRNMNYHGLLDWRLGISLLRIMNNSNHIIGMDGNFKDYLELQDWPKEAVRLGKIFAESFNFDFIDSFDLPAVIASKNRKFFIVVIHPFWNCKGNGIGLPDLPDDTWFSDNVFEVFEETQKHNARLCFIDTFNLHRRPGWCYQKLFSS